MNFGAAPGLGTTVFMDSIWNNNWEIKLFFSFQKAQDQIRISHDVCT